MNTQTQTVYSLGIVTRGQAPHTTVGMYCHGERAWSPTLARRAPGNLRHDPARDLLGVYAETRMGSYRDAAGYAHPRYEDRTLIEAEDRPGQWGIGLPPPAVEVWATHMDDGTSGYTLVHPDCVGEAVEKLGAYFDCYSKCRRWADERAANHRGRHPRVGPARGGR